MVVHVETMRRVGLGDRTVATDDRHVFIVVIRRRVTEIVASGDDDAIVGERIDHHDLIVDDRVASLVQFGFPLAEGIVLVNSLGSDHTVVLGKWRIALLALGQLVFGAPAINGRVESACRLGSGHRAPHEQ